VAAASIAVAVVRSVGVMMMRFSRFMDVSVSVTITVTVHVDVSITVNVLVSSVTAFMHVFLPGHVGFTFLSVSIATV